MAFDALKRLVRGLTRTREGIADSLRSVLGAHEIDEGTLEELETSLLAADLGPALTTEVLGSLPVVSVPLAWAVPTTSMPCENTSMPSPVSARRNCRTSSRCSLADSGERIGS